MECRDVLLGPHEQSIGGHRGHRTNDPEARGTPYAPYGPHAPWPWRTHKIAHRNDGSPQEKDGPELGAELARR
jgi:hypothetical protein